MLKIFDLLHTGNNLMQGLETGPEFPPFGIDNPPLTGNLFFEKPDNKTIGQLT